MIAIKFDEDKAKRCINAYYDMHKEYPYLICNDETEKILPSIPSTDITTISTTNYICIKDLVENPSKPRTKRWNNAKVLIDNELKFGEVHIG